MHEGVPQVTLPQCCAAGKMIERIGATNTGKFYLRMLNHSDELSDTGGYAHLISAASQWLLYLDGKKDWQTHRIPAAEAELPAASASEQRR